MSMLLNLDTTFFKSLWRCSWARFLLELGAVVALLFLPRATSLSVNRLALSPFCSCLMSVRMELFQGRHIFRALFLCCICALSMVFRWFCLGFAPCLGFVPVYCLYRLGFVCLGFVPVQGLYLSRVCLSRVCMSRVSMSRICSSTKVNDSDNVFNCNKVFFNLTLEWFVVAREMASYSNCDHI